jgi:hypothetical protein
MMVVDFQRPELWTPRYQRPVQPSDQAVTSTGWEIILLARAPRNPDQR